MVHGMKKRLKIAVLTTVFTLSMATASYADGWVQDENGWRYQEYDGSWRTDGWVADEKNEKIGYYLDENGYMLTNCYTPDGCWVNENGAWYDEAYGEVVHTTAEGYRGELFYPEETDYPLKGTLAYSIGFDGKPELFQNNSEYVQINSFPYSGEPRLHDNIILLYLAGLWDQGLTQYEVAVSDKLKEFLNSFDWKNASDYEKSEQAIRFIVEGGSYAILEGEGVETNSSYSALVKGVSACDGFARSFHLLTRAVDVKSFYIGNLSHAWNFIKMDDNYYEIDPSILIDVYHNQSSDFDFILKQYLSNPSERVNQYIWMLNDASLQFDLNASVEPLF